MLAGRKIKQVSRYVENLKCTEDFDVSNITVEHRSNNPKRDFLFVNKKQCKHIPCSGVEMVGMCKNLAHVVNFASLNSDSGYNVNKDKILVVAFAETATAIGNIVADNLFGDSYVMQTTREEVEGSKQLISFEEEHSHATTQKLLTYEDTDIDKFLSKYTYILFVEDEISTGNTILNFIKEFEKLKAGMRFGVASICNWQSEEDRRKFYDKGIDTFALITGQLVDANAKMVADERDSVYLSKYYKKHTENKHTGSFIYRPAEKVLGDNLFREERLGHDPNRNLTELYKLVDNTIERDRSVESVRVVGTEEFMYIPIKVAEYIEEKYGLEVICHSTTRSPIDIVKTSAYGWADGIVTKAKVPSVYDLERDTYLYNTDEYTDLTIVVTDGELTDNYRSDNYYELFKDTTKTVVVYSL